MVNPTHTIGSHHDDDDERPNPTNRSQLHRIILWNKAEVLYAYGQKSVPCMAQTSPITAWTFRLSHHLSLEFKR